MALSPQERDTSQSLKCKRQAAVVVNTEEEDDVPSPDTQCDSPPGTDRDESTPSTPGDATRDEECERSLDEMEAQHLSETGRNFWSESD